MGIHHRIASSQADLAVQVVGQGDPVVFLHANVCDSRMWQPQIDAIGTDHRAIAYDRRGFGGTRTEREAFSAVEDLMTVVDAVAGGTPPILVGCSQGGKIAIDAALRHPTRVRALVLIAPSVGGAPEVVQPPDIANLLARQKAAEDGGDLDAVNAIKARLWLDGPLAAEGRVTGDARRLFLDMNAIALRSPPPGTNRDVDPAYGLLGELTMPALVIWGEFDFPHIQGRCRHVVATVPNAKGHALAGTAHLPSLDMPGTITELLRNFIDRLKQER